VAFSLQQLRHLHPEGLREALQDADRRIVPASLELVDILAGDPRLLRELPWLKSRASRSFRIRVPICFGVGFTQRQAWRTLEEKRPCPSHRRQGTDGDVNIYVNFVVARIAGQKLVGAD